MQSIDNLTITQNAHEMQVPEKFPSGCEFFSSVRNIRNFVKYPNKKLYVLSWNGFELKEIRGIPATPIAPMTESAFLMAASRCRGFYTFSQRR